MLSYTFAGEGECEVAFLASNAVTAEIEHLIDSATTCHDAQVAGSYRVPGGNYHICRYGMCHFLGCLFSSRK